MRTRLAGPNSSFYKEQDIKVSPAIDAGIRGISYVEKQLNDIKKNPTGADIKKGVN